MTCICDRGALAEARAKSTDEIEPATAAATGPGMVTGQSTALPETSRRRHGCVRSAEEQASHPERAVESGE